MDSSYWVCSSNFLVCGLRCIAASILKENSFRINYWNRTYACSYTHSTCLDVVPDLRFKRYRCTEVGWTLWRDRWIKIKIVTNEVRRYQQTSPIITGVLGKPFWVGPKYFGERSFPVVVSHIQLLKYNSMKSLTVLQYTFNDLIFYFT